MSEASHSAARQDHDKLDVYHVALEFAGWQRRLRVPKGNADLADQLRRATTSVVLNVAEGAGEFSRTEKRRFYRMARRSAAECAAALDLLEAGGDMHADALEPGRILLSRVVAMLTRLVPREQA
jgi:four helix bundle protein